MIQQLQSLPYCSCKKWQINIKLGDAGTGHFGLAFQLNYEYQIKKQKKEWTKLSKTIANEKYQIYHSMVYNAQIKARLIPVPYPVPYQCHIWQHTLHIPTKVLMISSPNHSNQKKDEPYKRAYLSLSENGGFGKKTGLID